MARSQGARGSRSAQKSHLRNYSGDRSRGVGKGGAAVKRAQAKFGKNGCTCSTKKPSGEPRLKHGADCLLALAQSRVGTSYAAPLSKTRSSGGSTSRRSTTSRNARATRPSMRSRGSMSSRRMTSSGRSTTTSRAAKSSGAVASSVVAAQNVRAPSSSAPTTISSGAASSSGASTSSGAVPSSSHPSGTATPLAPSPASSTSTAKNQNRLSSKDQDLMPEKVRDLFEVMFWRTPFPSGEECNAQNERYGLKTQKSHLWFKNRRYCAVRRYLVNDYDSAHLPREMRALFGPYNRLGKKLASREQAVEVARAAKTTPFNVERCFHVFRRQERLFAKHVQVPEEDSCRKFVLWYSSGATEIPDGAGAIQEDPEYEAALAKAEAEAMAWLRAQDPLGNAQGQGAQEEGIQMAQEVDPDVEIIEVELIDPQRLLGNNRSHFLRQKRRVRQFGEQWFKDTPLPFDNSFEWRQWTNQHVLEFACQFLSIQGVRDLRGANVIGEDLEQFRTMTREITESTNITYEEVLQIRRCLAEMDRYKEHLEATSGGRRF